MESKMMKVVFSDIKNGSHRGLPENDAKNGKSESAAKRNIRFRHGILKKKTGGIRKNASREITDSLINATNCANLQNEKAVYGYMNLASDGALLQRHR